MTPEREFCKEKYWPGFNKQKHTKINLFEKVCLFFIKKQYSVDPIERTTLVYKTFNGKVFVLDHYINPPNHWNCRHSVHAF